jgi:hypothetical protein
MKWILFCAAFGGTPTGNWILWSPIGRFRYYDTFQEAQQRCWKLDRRSHAK